MIRYSTYLKKNDFTGIASITQSLSSHGSLLRIKHRGVCKVASNVSEEQTYDSVKFLLTIAKHLRDCKVSNLRRPIYKCSTAEKNSYLKQLIVFLDMA